MALRVIWTQAASRDIELAADHIARDSNQYASALVRDAVAAARSLDVMAKRGRIEHVPFLVESRRGDAFILD